MPIRGILTATVYLTLLLGHLGTGVADPKGLLSSTQVSENHERRSLKQGPVARIARGTAAPCGRYPYMTSLRDRFNIHRCGGVLIAGRWILTAAHCVDPESSTAVQRPIVVVGACGLNDQKNENGDVEMFRTEEVIVHERWTGSVEDGYDIALLMLNKESAHIPVGLPNEDETLRGGESLVAIGWGEKEDGSTPEVLQQATGIRFIQNSFCNEENVWGSIITNSMLCAFGLGSGQDVCQGDSGGPLLLPFAPNGDISAGKPAFDIVVGITSFGEGQECGVSVPGEEKPSVFSRTSSFREWLDTNMKLPQETVSRSLPIKTPASPASPETTTETEPELVTLPSPEPSPKPMEPPPELSPEPVEPPPEPSPDPLPVKPEPELVTLPSPEPSPKPMEPPPELSPEPVEPPPEPSPDPLPVEPVPTPSKEPSPRPSPPPTLKPDFEPSPAQQAGVDQSLWEAVARQDLTAVREALRSGADPDTTRDGSTVLVQAADKGMTGIVEALLMYGADPDKRDTNRITPLYKAGLQGHTQVVELLLTWGADPNGAVDDGSTPLYQASWFGHTGAVGALIEAGADVDKAKGDGGTPLYIASEYGKINNVFMLLNAGADPNRQRNDGASPLIAASKNGRCTTFATAKQVDVVMALLGRGADPNVADNKGNTPLHFASITLGVQSEMIVDSLLSEGAEVDAQARDGRTPLMWAAHFGNAGTARVLLAAGAVASISARDGSTAADNICRCTEIGGVGGQCLDVIPCAVNACHGFGDRAEIADLLA